MLSLGVFGSGIGSFTKNINFWGQFLTQKLVIFVAMIFRKFSILIFPMQNQPKIICHLKIYGISSNNPQKNLWTRPNTNYGRVPANISAQISRKPPIFYIFFKTSLQNSKHVTYIMPNHYMEPRCPLTPFLPK